MDVATFIERVGIPGAIIFGVGWFLVKFVWPVVERAINAFVEHLRSLDRELKVERERHLESLKIRDSVLIQGFERLAEDQEAREIRAKKDADRRNQELITAFRDLAKAVHNNQKSSGQGGVVDG